MKFVSLTLAILMFVLTGIPCDDSIPESDNDTFSSTEFVDVHNHSSESPDTDGCSPFCVCHCCHTHIAIPSQSKRETVVSLAITSDPADYFKDLFPRRISGAIWRPPQSA